HFLRRARSKLPMLKLFVRIFFGVSRAVASQHRGRVALPIKADAEQMRPGEQRGLLLEGLLELREIAAHQRAIVGQRTARVDEREDHCLATILLERNLFAILIRQRKIRHSVGFVRQRANLGVARVSRRASLPYHAQIFQPRLAAADDQRGGNLIASAHGAHRIQIFDLKRHDHRGHVPGNVGVTDYQLMLCLIDRDDFPCEWITLGAAKRYPLAGKVISVDQAKHQLVVSHADIPGYMPAMVMPFQIKDLNSMSAVGRGDEVSATLVVSGSQSWLEDLRVVRKGSATTDARDAEIRTLPHEADAVPDFSLTNQDGKKISLKQYRGKAVVLTFIYTRCPLPDYCPLMSSNFAQLEKALQQQPALF